MFFATKTATRKRTIINASPITVPYKRSPTAHSSKTSWAPAGCPMGEPKRKQHLPGGTRMKRRTSLSLPFRSFLLTLTCFFFFFFVQQRGNVSKIEKFRRAFYGYNVHRKQVMHVTALRRSSLKFFATTYYPSNCPFPFQVTFFPFSSERIRMKSLGFLFRFVYSNFTYY